MTRRNVELLAVTAVLVAGCLPEVQSRGGRGNSPFSSGDPSSGVSGPSAGSSYPSSGGSGSGSSSITFPAPDFGATVRQGDPPPPLSGGTLAVAPDGVTVVAADPDRDCIYVLDYRAPTTLRTLFLRLHDEPGRVAIDSANRAHVALRGGGAIVSIDLATGALLARRDVCSAPRGIAYDSASDVVHVACAAGDLVTLPASGGPETRRRFVVRDLRDVVVVPGAVLLSTFRDARILRLADAADVAVERAAPKDPTFGSPRVAWRMIAAPPVPGATPAPAGSDEILMARQKAPDDGDDGSTAPPATAGEYYPNTGACSTGGPGPVVQDRNQSIHVPRAVLPVDIATNGQEMAVVAAGNAHSPGVAQLLLLPRSAALPDPTFRCLYGDDVFAPGAQLTSVAFASSGMALLALSREPAALLVFDLIGNETARVALSTVSREDTGHAIFHANSGAGVACASCHPDGREDGHAWRSVELGARRTPSLLGTLSNTAPYHWNGEAADLRALMTLTFQSRMHGPALAPDQEVAVEGWLRALKAPPPAAPSDAFAVSRGAALFAGAGRCATCHSGPMRTNNASLDVGTGGVLQVPSLVGVAWRTPLLHDGSALTLGAALANGHGGAALQPQQVSDLTAYVETF